MFFFFMFLIVGITNANDLKVIYFEICTIFQRKVTFGAKNSGFLVVFFGIFEKLTII